MRTSLLPSLRFASLALAVAAPIAAQATHLVGPGGFATIPEALAVATPGDVVLVQAGSYPGFFATQGVTVRALGLVQVASISCTLPPGANLNLVDLRILGQVIVNGGDVALDHCRIDHLSFFGGSPGVQASQASVRLLGCTVNVGSTVSAALVATDCDVHVVDSELTLLGVTVSVPPPTVELTTSRLHASHCTLASVGSGTLGGSGVVAGAGSSVWLSDTAIANGSNSCPVRGGASFRIDRCTANATSASGCGTPTAGSPQLGIRQSAPLQSGAPLTLEFAGAPLQFVAIHASTGRATTPVPGLFEQPLALDLAGTWLVDIVAIDAFGVAARTWNMPAGMFVDTPLWLQAITVEPTLPWQVSPVVGGIVR